MKKYLGMLGLLIVTVIWGGGFVASDIALSSLSPAQILVTRFLLASVLMFPLCARHLKSIKKQEIRAGIILGVYLFAAFALQIVGLKYTTPSKNAFLTATNAACHHFSVNFLMEEEDRKQCSKNRLHRKDNGGPGFIHILLGCGLNEIGKSGAHRSQIQDA